MRIAAISFAAFAAALSASAPAFAGEAEDAYAAIKQFVDGFNSGEVDKALAACAPTGSAIDEFAPYFWSGENFCEVWANDFAADAEKKGLTDSLVTLHAPRHAFVDGDKAYIVAPVEYTYMIGGKKQGQTGSTLTVALEKQDGAWKITQWAWTQGKPKK